MDLSFAWTTPALVRHFKTVTRRTWTPEWATRFHEGDVLTALDRQRRYRGRPVGAVRLTGTPYLESTADAPDSDYQAEGFEYLESIGAKVDKLSPSKLWRIWHHPSGAQEMWVVRFELVSLTSWGQELRDRETVGAGALRLL